MAASPTTETLPLNLARDFLFSNVLSRLERSSRGITSTSGKRTLSDRVAAFKRLVGDNDALNAVFFGSAEDREVALAKATGENHTNTVFLSDAVDRTLSPSEDLLIRNRFVALLNEKIDSLPENKSMLREFLLLSSLYFYDDVVTEETIESAANAAFYSIQMRFHKGSYPGPDYLQGVLSELLEQAITAHQQAPDERIIPDAYTPERANGLHVNM